VISRRHALALVAASFAASCAAQVGPVASCERSELVYVGNDSTQLRAFRFDACAGTLAPIGVVAELPKPRWTVMHPQLPVMYVANEGTGKDGGVAAFTVDRRTGALSPLNEVDAGGAGTTHLSFDRESMTLLASNFGGGSVATVPVRADGRLDPPVSVVRASGSGPHRRQASPHAHAATVDPSGRFVLVADMGADRLFVYRFDRATRSLKAEAADAARAMVADPGSGPRRAVFGPQGNHVYVLNELTAEVQVFNWDDGRGQLTAMQSLRLSSDGFKGAASASEIMVSRDGRTVYVGDRGENTLVVYRVSPETGALAFAQRLPSGGAGPWAFDLHPSGRWLLVANFRDNRLNLFSVDPATGQLADTGRSIESPSPVSVSFVR